MTVPGERTHRQLGLIRDQPHPRSAPMTGVCRCVFDLTAQPPTVNGSTCERPEHREDAATAWNALPGLLRANLVNRSAPMTGRTFDFPATLIERAVDGDSLEATVMWENPFYIGSTPMPILLRVAGVDCWDKTTPRGIAAAARTAQLCEGRILPAVTFGPYTYGVGSRHRLGEWVGDVYVPTPDSVVYGPSDAVALSVILLTERLAMPYDGKGKRPTLGLPGTWPLP